MVALLSAYIDVPNVYFGCKEQLTRVEEVLQFIENYAGKYGRLDRRLAYLPKNLKEKNALTDLFKKYRYTVKNSEWGKDIDTLLIDDVYKDVTRLRRRHWIIVSGDTDFMYMVKTLRDKGKKVHVLSPQNSCRKKRGIREYASYATYLPD